MARFTDEQVHDEFNKYSENVTEDDVSGVLDKEEDILKKIKGPLEKFAKYIKLFFSLIKDYSKGIYKEVPWKTIAAVIGTLIYIFSPIDLIPDFIPFIGLVDDAAVLALCLKTIADDLDKYEKWKESQAEYKIIN